MSHWEVLGRPDKYLKKDEWVGGEFSLVDPSLFGYCLYYFFINCSFFVSKFTILSNSHYHKVKKNYITTTKKCVISRFTDIIN